MVPAPLRSCTEVLAFSKAHEEGRGARRTLWSGAPPPYRHSRGCQDTETEKRGHAERKKERKQGRVKQKRNQRGPLGFELQRIGSGAILALCPMVPLKRDRTLWRYL